jgi:hypothetical protein
MLTPWSRVSLQKLTDTQIIKKFSALYGTGVHKSPPLVPTQEPDESSSQLPTPFLYDVFQYYPPIYA